MTALLRRHCVNHSCPLNKDCKRYSADRNVGGFVRLFHPNRGQDGKLWCSMKVARDS